MLFTGDDVPRQAARGLMWLTLAKDARGATDQAWIAELYDSAFQQATDDERALALVYLERWLRKRGATSARSDLASRMAGDDARAAIRLTRIAGA